MYKFSKDELRVLELLGQGLTEHEISEALDIDDDEFKVLFQALADKIDWYEPHTTEGLSQALLFERSRRARLLAQLHASESRFHALMDLTPNGILIVDGHSGRILHANHQTEFFFGYTATELIGMEVERLIAPEERELHVKQRTGFLRSIRKREIGYHPPIYALQKNGTRLELVIGLIATSTSDDVMVICTKMSEAIAKGLVATREAR